MKNVMKNLLELRTNIGLAFDTFQVVKTNLGEEALEKLIDFCVDLGQHEGDDTLISVEVGSALRKGDDDLTYFYTVYLEDDEVALVWDQETAQWDEPEWGRHSSKDRI